MLQRVNCRCVGCLMINAAATNIGVDSMMILMRLSVNIKLSKLIVLSGVDLRNSCSLLVNYRVSFDKKNMTAPTNLVLHNLSLMPL